MILEEFKDIFKDGLMLVDTASEKEIIMSFNYGLMTQIDDYNVDKNGKMSFDEFVDALGRVADRLYVKSYNNVFIYIRIPIQVKKLENQFKIIYICH